MIFMVLSPDWTTSASHEPLGVLIIVMKAWVYGCARRSEKDDCRCPALRYPPLICDVSSQQSPLFQEIIYQKMEHSGACEVRNIASLFTLCLTFWTADSIFSPLQRGITPFRLWAIGVWVGEKSLSGGCLLICLFQPQCVLTRDRASWCFLQTREIGGGDTCWENISPGASTRNYLSWSGLRSPPQCSHKPVVLVTLEVLWLNSCLRSTSVAFAKQWQFP